MEGLPGKNALVTGASSGIGQSIAAYFGQAGANVAINYLDDLDDARKTERMIHAAEANSGTSGSVDTVLIQADVSLEDDVRRMVSTTIAELGGLDILINNAGIQIAGNSHQLPIEDFDKVLSVNLRGAFMAAQAAIEHFLSAGKPGVIVNVSSVHQIIPKPRFLGYSVSKGGMRNLTRTLALEYASRGIRVNGIGPGAIETPINRAWVDNSSKREIVNSHIPMGRVGTSGEIAAITAFLCSDLAAYVTGQTLYADGGLTLFPDFRETWSSE